MRVCFYAAVADPSLFDIVEFYRQDIRALEDLGHEVTRVREPRDLRPGFDLYWVWWPTSGTPALVTARLRRRPSVLVTAISDRDQTASGFGAKPPWTRAAARLSMAIADLILTTSDDTRRGLERYRTRSIATAYLGMDTAFYSPARGGSNGTEVVTVSHLTADNVERKRILDVVRIAAAVRARRPDVRFTIIGGEGDGAASVRAEIERLGVGDTVRLAGRVSAEEKQSLIANCAVYLQPTTYEAFGVAMAEAMACGAAVLSSSVGAVPEVVGEAGRLLGAAATPADFAGALVEMLEDPGLDHVRSNARARVEAMFTFERRRAAVQAALNAVAPSRA
jgi:glycosyltransferase involved in cell wall biosynthesis